MPSTADIILISESEGGGVCAAVSDVLSTIDGCRLHVFDETSSIDANTAPCVLIYHHAVTQELSRGLETMRRIIATFPTTAVIVISEHDDVARRQHFIECGAADCLLFPLDANRLAFMLDLLTVRERLTAPNKSTPRSSRVVDDALNGSPAMVAVMEQLNRVALLPVTLLLTGETGSGKTHLARYVHRIGRRTDRFLTVDCGSVPSTLIESEFFGHTKGAFTGATEDHKGKFEAVGDGTLLLDEVDALPWEMQTRLLRVVEDREYESLGSTKTKTFRGRLIAATNQDLEKAVADKRFREDLFYRLNVITIVVPPLRDRVEDILELANAFVEKFTENYHLNKLAMSDAAKDALRSYSWPGNVRELRNVIERCCVLATSDRIDVTDFPTALRGHAQGANGEFPSNGVTVKSGTNELEMARTDAERFRLEASIRRHANNRSQVAMELGISRVTLYKKLHKFGLM